MTDIRRRIPHAKEAEDTDNQRRQSYKNQVYFLKEAEISPVKQHHSIMRYNKIINRNMIYCAAK